MFLNVSAYKFVELTQIKSLQVLLKAKGNELAIKGTILLGNEGVNMSLAGDASRIADFQAYFASFPFFAEMNYKNSYSQEIPFSKFVVKIKPEIVTMKDERVNVIDEAAVYIEPEELKQWLDAGVDFKLLDTRNQFEYEFGTFNAAEQLNIDKFSDFPQALAQLEDEWKEKPVVTFCTGGIRCEKAARAMQQAGFKKVYQLAGGILNYFEQCKDAHWHGECFVFDDRIALDAELKEVRSRG